MIFVSRTDEPRALIRNKDRWQRNLDAVLVNPNPDPNVFRRQKELATNKYRHNEIKESLKNMFHGKCAYCESEVTTVTYGDIEHFKPKSIFPKLTFTWNNLLFSCTICNDAGHKGDTFPLDADGQQILIDPTNPQESIENHLDFIWDANTETAFVLGKTHRGREIIKIFDLNGVKDRTPLIRRRSRYIERTLALIIYAREGNQTALTLLRQVCQSDAEYSAFSRKICSEAHLWP